MSSADCSQCNERLDTLLDLLLKATATGADDDRQKAGAYAGKLGFDLRGYITEKA